MKYCLRGDFIGLFLMATLYLLVGASQTHSPHFPSCRNTFSIGSLRFA